MKPIEEVFLNCPGQSLWLHVLGTLFKIEQYKIWNSSHTFSSQKNLGMRLILGLKLSLMLKSTINSLLPRAWLSTSLEILESYWLWLITWRCTWLKKNSDPHLRKATSSQGHFGLEFFLSSNTCWVWAIYCQVICWIQCILWDRP